jgi:rRNA-processing protein FCF1
VLLDTNALFLPVRARFPLEVEVARLCPGGEIRVPTSVIGELDRLVLRDAPDARAARELANHYRSLPAPGLGDDAVLEAASGRNAWVVTSDRAFRARLVARGVTVLFPRDRHRLERFPGETAPRGSRGNG